MPGPEGYLEVTRTDIEGMFPFFGPRSLFVDSVRVSTNPDGTVGDKAIGLWTVTPRACEEHFRKNGDIDIQLLPGHYYSELLGQTLGILAFQKYPEFIKTVLPAYNDISKVDYEEPAFVGDKINLCVELLEVTDPDRHGLRSIIGRGVAIFNNEVLSRIERMAVDIIPAKLTMRSLGRIKTRHQTEEWVPASFENFDQYFAS